MQINKGLFCDVRAVKAVNYEEIMLDYSRGVLDFSELIYMIKGGARSSFQCGS